MWMSVHVFMHYIFCRFWICIKGTYLSDKYKQCIKETYFSIGIDEYYLPIPNGDMCAKDNCESKQVGHIPISTQNH